LIVFELNNYTLGVQLMLNTLAYRHNDASLGQSTAAFKATKFGTRFLRQTPSTFARQSSFVPEFPATDKVVVMPTMDGETTLFSTIGAEESIPSQASSITFLGWSTIWVASDAVSTLPYDFNNENNIADVGGDIFNAQVFENFPCEY
jgi:hypothetical protein